LRTHDIHDSASYHLAHDFLADRGHSLKAALDFVERGSGSLVYEVMVVVHHESFLQTMIGRLAFFYPLLVEP
jgi:hypothetical protein